MLRVGCVLLFGVLVSATVADAEEEIVGWRAAAQCIGRVCGVRGPVAVVEEDGATIRLYFDAANREVRVVLMRGWLVTWPSYAGTTIIANGKVQRFRDHIEQIVLDPHDVVIVDGGPTPTAETAAPPPTVEVPTAAPLPAAAPPPPPPAPPAPALAAPTPTPSEVEQLRQRVRELEQHIRELEEH